MKMTFDFCGPLKVVVVVFLMKITVTTLFFLPDRSSRVRKRCRP